MRSYPESMPDHLELSLNDSSETLSAEAVPDQRPINDRHAVLKLQAAQEMRQSGQYEAALKLFEAALSHSLSAEAGAGLVYCLRRLKRFDQAEEKLAELLAAFPNNKELITESGWLGLSTKIYPMLQKGMLGNAVLGARDILDNCSDRQLRRYMVFQIIKEAKARQRWEILDEVCDWLDPAELSLRPPSRQANGWSDRSRWTAAKIVALLHLGQLEEAFNLAKQGVQLFPEQQLFFNRWQAQALAKIGRLEEAVALYEKLCARHSRDWWILHEYGQTQWQIGNGQQAVIQFCAAALQCTKVEMAIQLLQDLAACSLQEQKLEMAAHTADLAIQIRQQHGWRVPQKLMDILSQVSPLDNQSAIDRLNACRQLWKAELAGSPLSGLSHNGKSSPPEHQGRMGNLDNKRPFCFIQEGSERFFCLCADLPDEIAAGDLVSFQLVPSYDHKKNQPSCRAAHVQLIAPKLKNQI